MFDMDPTNTAPRVVRCQIMQVDIPLDDAIPVDLIRDSLLPLIQSKSNPWDPQGFVSLEELNKARAQHVASLLSADDVDTEKMNKEVLTSVQEHELLAKNVDREFEKNQSFGDRMADKIAAFGGSWRFIGIFTVILLVWMFANTAMIMAKPLDPFPYIFLNLILSCLAAIQAPVIMMSQNRQQMRDQMRGDNDYKVNMKAEIEVRAINEKVDKLLNDQWKHLLEIQQMQMDMIQEMTRTKKE
jgi:uncharacterized membrane protein